MDFPKVRCHLCRKSSLEHNAPPACIGGTCPTGHDTLPPQALRLLEIRSLLVAMHDLHLAGLICNEYGVDAEDLKILAEIEELLKEHAQPDRGETNG